MPQLRQNIITGFWVVVAPERAKRPQDFFLPKSEKITDKNKCPFCKDTDGYKSNKQIKNAETDNFYVIDNKYPVFQDDIPGDSIRSYYPESGFYRAKSAYGKHEVIVAKDHDTSLLKFSKSRMTEMLEVIRARYLDMAEDENNASIMPIYNHGAEAGASIDHPHAQIFASGVVSNTVGMETHGANRYFGINGACVFCDIIAHEKKEKSRVIYENEFFISTTFFASRFPFETWIYPKRHESQFENTSKNMMAHLADALTETLRMMDKTLENPPLNMYIHTLPTIVHDSDSFHWHVEIVPRVTQYGGFELGSDVIVNTMSPEEAADYLKG